MLSMTEESKAFFEKHLPAVLKAESRQEALIMLYDLIDENGFAPPHYDEYNDFGREAQQVYDDVRLSNQ